MYAVLDMALDVFTIIKTNKQASGPARRLSNRAANRTVPYYAASAANAQEMTWQQDSYAPYIETGTKLYITNLDYGVSNDDIKELFSEVGDLKCYGVHYDRSGRSKRYSNVQLAGKPIKIEIVRANISTFGVAPAANGAIGNFKGFPRSEQGRGGAFGRPGGRGQGIRRGRGHGRGCGGGRREKLSANELDTELEKYHAEAMGLN